ncbi:MAG TPA: S8 family serine peptidase, partial [Taishania sp.]|nr:S8 family serine peptidase [Taishania sp.]
TYHFARFSGTSMSSPVVTGVCALLWEVNPYLTPRQVKEIIINTARQDNNTGVLPSTGDPRWGYGKLNAMAALKEVLLLVGLDEIDYNNTVWDVYPNPANNTFKINGLTDIETIQLIDATGRIVELDNTLAEWSTSIFESGVYTVRIIANKYVYQKKLLIL